MIDKITYIQTKDEKFPMAFTLNVMEAIQNEYGSLNKWSDLIQNNEEPDIKALKFFITEAINEAIDIKNETTNDKIKSITYKKAGRILTDVGIEGALNKVSKTVIDSVEKEGNTKKNEQPTKN